MTKPDLRSLFAARSIALVGATEKSAWCHILMQGVRSHGYEGIVHLVNPKGGAMFGQTAVTACTAIGQPVDLAVFMVPVAALEDAMLDAARAGIRNAVVLTSGFSELGAEGVERQQRLAGIARGNGITLLGPNSLGFVNFAANVPAMVIPPQLPVLKGSVAVVSQSGATAQAVASFAHQQNVGLSHLVALGNEATVGMAEVVDYLVDEESVKVIALFIETIRDSAGLIDAAARALRARKPIIVLKVGTSELTAKVAQAHTGALVGDDRVFDAACLQLGLIRVRSMEEMVVTAGLLAHTGPIAPRGLAVVSISGGACEMVADAAEEFGVPLPPFAPATLEPLRGALSELGASTHNPLDITGAAVAKPEMFRGVLAAAGADPAVGLIATVYGLPSASNAVSARNGEALGHIAAGMAATGKPGILLTQTLQPIDETSRRVMEQAGLPLATGGLRGAMQAIGHALHWSERCEQAPYRPSDTHPQTGQRPAGERATLDFLHGHGIPVIPATVATTEGEAVAAFHAAGGDPVVLKIASPDIAHKTEVGGVLLNLGSDEAVADGFRRILDNVRTAAPDARIDGVIVSPMRAKGVELFVGVARDPQWGLALAVALGGVWVEALKDSSLRLLPVDRDAVVAMLNELKAATILRGHRGAAGIDLEAVADVAVRIGEAAAALGPDLESLEVNPLHIGPDGRIECLDALALWSDAASPLTAVP